MSNVFKEQTPEKFDDEKIHELFPVEELEEALAQIERGEVYTIEEVEAELANPNAAKNVRSAILFGVSG